MCGRYSLFTPPRDLAERFGVSVPEGLEPRYNAAPGQDLPVVRSDADGELRTARWGFLREWDGKRRTLINARAETVADRPAFREAYRSRRCLVPADGFYEWVEEDGAKQPYRVRLTDDEPFAMAGLWETWTPDSAQTDLTSFDGADPRGPETQHRFTVVTTEPNDVVAALHDRMAVILPPGEERRWLHADPDAARDLMRPYPSDDMEAYPVSTAVNDPSNDAPELVQPLG